MTVRIVDFHLDGAPAFQCTVPDDATFQALMKTIHNENPKWITVGDESGGHARIRVDSIVFVNIRTDGVKSHE